MNALRGSEPQTSGTFLLEAAWQLDRPPGLSVLRGFFAFAGIPHKGCSRMASYCERKDDRLLDTPDEPRFITVDMVEKPCDGTAFILAMGGTCQSEVAS